MAIIIATIQQRIDTEANWASANPTLLDGEIAISSDSTIPNNYKVGAGAWSDLSYVIPESAPSVPRTGLTFTGVYDLSEYTPAVYNDYTGDPLTSLSIAANPLPTSTATGRIPGELSLFTMPSDWALSGTAISTNSWEMNELTVMFIKKTDIPSETDIRAVNRVLVIGEEPVTYSINVATPTEDQQFYEGDPIELTSSVSPDPGMTAEVRYYNGATLIGTGTVGSDYAFSWDDATAADYAITAKLYIDDVLEAVSTAISIAVNEPETYSITLTSPLAAEAFDQGDSIALTCALSSVPAGTITVDYYQGTTLIGTGTVGTDYEYIWTGAANGSYTITAKLYADGVLQNTSGVTSITVAAAASYSATAQTVFGNMNSGLPIAYKNAIKVFVDSLVTAGVWAKLDEVQCPALNTSANGRRGWKGVAHATLGGGVVNTRKTGAVYNGTNAYTNPGFVPATHGVNYTLNSAFVSVYVRSGTYPALGNANLFGAFPTSTGGRVSLGWDKTGGITQLKSRINNINAIIKSDQGEFTALKQYTVYRNTSSTIALFEGDANINQATATSGARSDIAPFIGAYNNGGTAAGFFTGTIFIYFFGGGALTAQQFTDFKNATETFRTSIDAI